MTSFAIMQRNRRKLIDDLVRFSEGLDVDIVEKVVVYAECLTASDGSGINEATFISQMSQHFNLTCQSIISSIFNVLKPVRYLQKNLTVEQFCRLLCIFLTKNQDVKIDFVFSVYDLDRDDVLSKSEIYSMLKPTLPQDEDEHDDMLKDLIELVLKVVDRDGNGAVELEEFRQLVKKDVLYMELLGQCLPEDKFVYSFSEILMKKTVLELKSMFKSEYTLAMLGSLIPEKKTGYYPFPLEY